MPTYEITGEWTGPRNPAGNYTREAHCEHVNARATGAARDFVDAVSGLGSIEFTDGTRLILRVRDVTKTPPSRRKPNRPQYDSLIRKCVRHGVNRVEDLPR